MESEQINLSAYPNPGNPFTTIQFHLSQSGHGKLVIYDVLAGRYGLWWIIVLRLDAMKVVWDGKATYGRVVSSGVYLCRLFVRDAVSKTVKILVTK